MYCPDCGGEYRPGIETCPTCDLALTERPPEASEARRFSDQPRPVLADLVGFIDEHEARDARRKLKEARLASELVIRDAHGPDGDEPVNDEYWIRVATTDKDRAADLLGLEPVLSEDACPSCGAPLQGDSQCSRCGYRFEP